MSLRPVIVGGGSAGMAAAIELARHGVSSVLFDEASRLGGWSIAALCAAASTWATWASVMPAR
ncbi:FAD-dependent oxidoreductase [Pseudomonas qingdaonensis]|nr:FAD-dependent oxidoreductase [Pseudomonas qingdaonensis]